MSDELIKYLEDEMKYYHERVLDNTEEDNLALHHFCLGMKSAFDEIRTKILTSNPPSG